MAQATAPLLDSTALIQATRRRNPVGWRFTLSVWLCKRIFPPPGTGYASVCLQPLMRLLGVWINMSRTSSERFVRTAG